jgi:polysaccharide chain length determinant protein (PEP-CTERM system associated)
MANVEQSLHLLAQQLRDELRGTWRFRWHALAVAVLVTLLGSLIVATLPDNFLATSKFYVDASSRLGRLLQGLAVETNVENQVAYVRQALLSRPHLAELAASPEFGHSNRTAAQQDRLLDSLRNKIELTPDHNVTSGGGIMLSVSYQDPSRDRALYIVKSLVDGFVAETQVANRAKAEEAQTFLLKELADLEGKLAASEDKLAEFKKEHFGVLPGQGGDYFSRLQTEREGLDHANNQLSVIMSQREELNAQLRGQSPMVATAHGTPQGMSTGQKDIDARIKDSEAKLEDLLLRYTEKHPEVIALKATIADLKARRATELQALRNGSDGGGSLAVEDNPLYQSIKLQLNKIEVDAAAARADIAQRERRIADLQRSINTAPNVEAELGRLDRNYGATKGQYEALLERLQRAHLSESAEETGVVKFEIIDPPEVKAAPVGPNRMLMLLAVFVAAVGSGAALAYILHQLRPVVSNAVALGSLTHLPVFGTVSIGRLEAHKAAWQGSALRFAGALCALMVLFGAAMVMRNSTAMLVQRILG